MAGKVVIEDSGTGLSTQSDRDWLDAANILAAAHNPTATDFQVSGFGLTPDYGVPEVQVASGMAKVAAQDIDTIDHGGGTTTWPAVTVTVLVEAATLALTDGDVNDIYIDVGLTSGPDDVQLVAVDSNGSAPAEPALKIAEVDTSSDTATPINEHPDATVGTLDAETVNVSGTMDASVVSAENGEFTNQITDPQGNVVTDLSESVRVTEESITFEESNITVTNNQTTINDGSVGLVDLTVIDDFEDGDITTLSNKWDGWTGDTGALKAQTGTVISGVYSGELSAPNAVTSISTTRDSITATDRVALLLRSDNQTGDASDLFDVRLSASSTFIDNINFTDDGNITVGGNDVSTWSANTTYLVEIKNIDYSNDTYDLAVDGSIIASDVSFSNSASGIDTLSIRNITANSNQSRNLYIDDVQVGGPQSTTNGDVLVQWDEGTPDDIDSWDLATYQRTLDGETVTVDIEDSTGTVLKSDVSKDTDISDIAASTDVQLRANISRNNTSNNPTLDYAARRFTR